MVEGVAHEAQRLGSAADLPQRSGGKYVGWSTLLGALPDGCFTTHLLSQLIRPAKQLLQTVIDRRNLGRRHTMLI